VSVIEKDSPSARFVDAAGVIAQAMPEALVTVDRAMRQPPSAPSSNRPATTNT
jgi:hypothetical protein